jgi:hypothetical protein
VTRAGLFVLIVLASALCPAPVGAARASDGNAGIRPAPLMRDFMGLNVHTVQFKPDLYAPVCRRLRDYHPMNWDVGDDPGRVTAFPFAANRVDWGSLYGSWVKAGYDIDACLMFDQIAPTAWKGPARDARAYGEAFARFFGPSGAHRLVSSAEVGNEPSKYSPELYRTLFEAMARGLRAGDPKLTIATCAVRAGKADEWSKPLSAIDGLEELYDVLNVHTYPFKEHWPTWRRSYPEDPAIAYLKDVEELTRWRDAHVPGKQVWVTEFGYDSASKPPDPNGEWAKWIGVSDEEQARYVVRSFLCLSALTVERAYLYFFNDKDEPQLHAASGLTRNYRPKPAFHAVSHLYRTLGDYRFVNALAREDGGLYCFKYAHGSRPAERVYVAWLANGTDQRVMRALPVGERVHRAERMPTRDGEPPIVPWKPAAGGGVEVEVGAAPLYLWAR